MGLNQADYLAQKKERVLRSEKILPNCRQEQTRSIVPAVFGKNFNWRLTPGLTI